MYDELYHHGVLGMKWGVRRYQNKDGSRIKGARARARAKAIGNGSLTLPKIIDFHISPLNGLFLLLF